MSGTRIKRTALIPVLLVLWLTFPGLSAVFGQDAQALERQVNEARQRREELERNLRTEKDRTAALERQLADARPKPGKPSPPPSRDPINTWGHIGVEVLPYTFADKEDYDPGIWIKPSFGFSSDFFSLELFTLVWYGDEYDPKTGTEETKVQLQNVVLQEGLRYSIPVFDQSDFGIYGDNYNNMLLYPEADDRDDPEILGLLMPGMYFQTYWDTYTFKFSFGLPVSYMPETEISYTYGVSIDMQTIEDVSLNVSFFYNSSDLFQYTLDEYSLRGYYLRLEERLSFFDYNTMHIRGDLFWHEAEDGDLTYTYQIAMGFRFGSRHFGLLFEAAYGDFNAPLLDAGLSVCGGIQISF